MTLGTKQSYAALKGFTKPYLSKPEIKEMLEAAMEVDPADGKKKLNFEKADELFAARKDPAQPDRRGARPDGEEKAEDPDKARFTDVKTNRELIKLENDQLDLMRRKGETLLRQDVIDAWAAAGQRMQELQRACALRMAEKFSTMNDTRQIKALMDEEFRNINQTIHDDLMRKIGQQEYEAGAAGN